MSEKKNTGKKAVIAVIVIALIVVIIALVAVISQKGWLKERNRVRHRGRQRDDAKRTV